MQLAREMAVAFASDPIQFEGPRGWIVATLIAVVVIAAFGLPVYEKIRTALGAAAQPRVDTHNKSADSHGDIRIAVALLNNSVLDLQRQITKTEEHRKESFETIQRQLQMAIDLLPKD